LVAQTAGICDGLGVEGVIRQPPGRKTGVKDRAQFTTWRMNQLE
jgi:hypothetical protein